MFLSVYPCDFYLIDNLKYRSLENIFWWKDDIFNALRDAITRWSDTMNVCLQPWGALWPYCKKCVLIINLRSDTDPLQLQVLLWTQLTSMQYKLLKSVPRGFVNGIIPFNAWLPVTSRKFIEGLKNMKLIEISLQLKKKNESQISVWCPLNNGYIIYSHVEGKK